MACLGWLLNLDFAAGAEEDDSSDDEIIHRHRRLKRRGRYDPAYPDMRRSIGDVTGRSGERRK